MESLKLGALNGLVRETDEAVSLPGKWSQGELVKVWPAPVFGCKRLSLSGWAGALDRLIQ